MLNPIKLPTHRYFITNYQFPLRISHFSTNKENKTKKTTLFLPFTQNFQKVTTELARSRSETSILPKRAFSTKELARPRSGASIFPKSALSIVIFSIHNDLHNVSFLCFFEQNNCLSTFIHIATVQVKNKNPNNHPNFSHVITADMMADPFLG